METISEIIIAIFILCLGILTLTEFFYHIIRNRTHKKRHGHTPPPSIGDDMGKESRKDFLHTGNGASHLFAFFPLLTITLINIFFTN